MAVRYGTLVRPTPQFLLRSTVRFFCKGTGTVRRYGTPFLQRYGCGVKELIMFIARANAAITQTMYQMIYPSESNSERFNLFLCHVSGMYQR